MSGTAEEAVVYAEDTPEYHEAVELSRKIARRDQLGEMVPLHQVRMACVYRRAGPHAVVSAAANGDQARFEEVMGKVYDEVTPAEVRDDLRLRLESPGEWRRLPWSYDIERFTHNLPETAFDGDDEIHRVFQVHPSGPPLSQRWVRAERKAMRRARAMAVQIARLEANGDSADEIMMDGALLLVFERKIAARIDKVAPEELLDALALRRRDPAAFRGRMEACRPVADLLTGMGTHGRT